MHPLKPLDFHVYQKFYDAGLCLYVDAYATEVAAARFCSALNALIGESSYSQFGFMQLTTAAGYWNILAPREDLFAQGEELIQSGKEVLKYVVEALERDCTGAAIKELPAGFKRCVPVLLAAQRAGAGLGKKTGVMIGQEDTRVRPATPPPGAPKPMATKTGLTERLSGQLVAVDIMQSIVKVLSSDGKIRIVQMRGNAADYINKIFAATECDFFTEKHTYPNGGDPVWVGYWSDMTSPNGNTVKSTHLFDDDDATGAGNNKQ